MVLLIKIIHEFMIMLLSSLFNIHSTRYLLQGHVKLCIFKKILQLSSKVLQTAELFSNYNL